MIRKTLQSAANRIAFGAPPADGVDSFTQVNLTSLDGEPLDPAALEGKVILFVNVASRCGLTPQYSDLVELQNTYAERGFTVVGAPCNQFLGQEPGSAEEIAEFCSITYGVDFPLLDKQHVNGKDRSPLYQWLIGSEAGGGDDIQWNFEKFLVSREGTVLKRFAPKTRPSADKVIAAIEAAL